ncbi:MAG: enoyl-CoA hydratase/isomerase family protein [Dehalococcoidales bacterium]|nr:enoyl-CoA hydratase/isomerase family protein [Dehalococcoidales bacterium]
MKEIKNIAVIGAGNIGAQIAALAAESGYKVNIRDIEDKLLERARKSIEDMYDNRISRGRLSELQKQDYMSRLSFILDLKDAVANADAIIEAVPEILELKQSVIKEITALCPEHAVFATNTSSLSITEISKSAKKPDTVIGTHFFNPPSRMTLLEIVHGDNTSSDTVKIAETIAAAMGRAVVHVKDVPGFVANRIFCTMTNEADWALYQKECKSAFEIDSAVKYKLGLPLGMLELQDTLGGGSIDTQYDVMEYFGSQLGESYGPAPILTELYHSGNYGKKTGKGYYEWSEENNNEIPMNAGVDFDPIRLLAPGVNEAAKLIEMGATTREEIDTAMLLGLNYPRGILRMADSVGIDIIVAEMNRLEDTYKVERYKCCKLLTELVKQGNLGRKTCRGFYSYGMGEYEFVKLDINLETKVAKLILNRPSRANALNYDFIIDISNALNVVERQADVQCLIITGSGSNFCSGADVSAFASGQMDDVMNFSNNGHDLFTRIEIFPKPVIAAINGPAIGGGLELAMSCDIRVMSSQAQLRLPELSLGLTPGWGGTQRLIRLIGGTRAREMVLLSEPVMAEKALHWGLVNFIEEPDTFVAKVDEIANKLANGAPLAQKLAKALFYYGAQGDQRTGSFIESSVSASISLTKDLNDGLTSMSYRRSPEFKGR